MRLHKPTEPVEKNMWEFNRVKAVDFEGLLMV